MARKWWTATDIETMRSMLDDGKSHAEIGKHLGRTKSAVSKYAVKHGMASETTNRPWAPEEIATVHEMMTGGHTHREIGDRIGRTRLAVAVYCQDNGIKSRGTDWRWRPEEIELLVELGGDASLSELAEKFGRSTAAISMRIHRLGLARRPSMHRGVAKTPDWSEAEDDTVREMYAMGAKAADVCEVLQRSIYAVRNRVHTLGLTRRVHSLPIGAEAMRNGMLMRKVSSKGQKYGDQWRRVDVIDWEAVHGPVPAGYLLMVINKHQPRTPDNLQLIKKDDLWKTITGQDMPPEVRELLRLRQLITRAMRKQSAA